MFGETAAVYSFVRLSRAIAHIAAKLLHLVVVEFFDDFTQIAQDELAEDSQMCLEWLIGILGWQLATEDKKRLPFARKCVALGVELDYTEAERAIIKVGNKPGRLDEISQIIDSFKSGTQVGFKEALSIRGKISFAESCLFGRLAACAGVSWYLAYVPSAWRCGTDLP